MLYFQCIWGLSALGWWGGDRGVDMERAAGASLTGQRTSRSLTRSLQRVERGQREGVFRVTCQPPGLSFLGPWCVCIAAMFCVELELAGSFLVAVGVVPALPQ